MHFANFDTEHTRFATKYSLYLYREQGIDEDNKVSAFIVVLANLNERLGSLLGPTSSCMAYQLSSSLATREVISK